MRIAIGAGLEQISLVQNEHQNKFRRVDPRLQEMHPNAYMPMLQTAEVVATRYGISRERQDEYSLQSQQRTAAAQQQSKPSLFSRCPHVYLLFGEVSFEVGFPGVAGNATKCSIEQCQTNLFVDERRHRRAHRARELNRYHGDFFFARIRAE